MNSCGPYETSWYWHKITYIKLWFIANHEARSHNLGSVEHGLSQVGDSLGVSRDMNDEVIITTSIWGVISGVVPPPGALGMIWQESSRKQIWSSHTPWRWVKHTCRVKREVALLTWQAPQIEWGAITESTGVRN
jgi:hypothetical protein